MRRELVSHAANHSRRQIGGGDLRAKLRRKQERGFSSTGGDFEDTRPAHDTGSASQLARYREAAGVENVEAEVLGLNESFEGGSIHYKATLQECAGSLKRHLDGKGSEGAQACTRQETRHVNFTLGESARTRAEVLRLIFWQ